ncbi:MAG: hypothetical protein AB1384_00180 [Actinomycetota bacterium]
MRKTMVLLFIIACLASFALFAGCGNEDKAGGEGAGSEEVTETTETEEQVEITDDEGKKITVEESQEEGEADKVIIEGEDGEQSTIEVQDQAPSEEALGAPIYPGSLYVEGSGVAGTTDSAGQEVSISGAEFTTGDAIDKVVDWYKGKLGTPAMPSPESTTWMLQTEDGAIVTVIVELFEDKVKITIARVTGSGVDLTP